MSEPRFWYGVPTPPSLNEDGTICEPGLGYPRGQRRPHVVYRNGDFIVVRMPGMAEWRRHNLGKIWFPTRWRLIELTKPLWTIHEEVETGREWAGVRRSLTNSANKMATHARLGMKGGAR